MESEKWIKISITRGCKIKAKNKKNDGRMRRKRHKFKVVYNSEVQSVIFHVRNCVPHQQHQLDFSLLIVHAVNKH